MDTIHLEEKLLLALLASEEYADYLCWRKDGDGPFIDMKGIPKDHYLTVGGDYGYGFILGGKLNETRSDLVRVERRTK